jgi:FkbM family methyltransferase
LSWRTLTAHELSDAGLASAEKLGHFRPNFFQRLLIQLCQHTFLKRGAARAWMTSLILACGDGHLDIFFRRAAFRIYGGNNLIEFGLLLNPGYNGVEIDFLLDGAGKDANFVDIGCNIGLYSLPLAMHAPSGRVLAIDANPKMVERIQWNADASGAENVLVVHTGVGDVSGQCDLLIRRDDLAIVSVEMKSDGQMPMRLLHEVIQCAGLETIHGLKIDIEGFEDKALVPFLNSAPAELLPKKIVIEHPTATSDYPGCTEAFARLGYELVSRTRNNSLYQLQPMLRA